MTNISLLITALLIFASCQGKHEVIESSKEIKKNFAISERAQQVDQFIALIQLQEKPLLEFQAESGNFGEVNKIQKVKILREQNQFIKDLVNISPDIKVIYRYQMVLNAVAIVVPKQYETLISQMSGISYMEAEGYFEAVQTVQSELEPFEESGDDDTGTPSLATKNSTSFIGALKAQNQLGIDGTNIKVGIIDSGVDYLHKMLGGPGTEEAYKEMKLAEANAFFPNNKVVGGIDLVGEEYDASSPVFDKHIPKPDDNPMDEGGHGTHVAGSVAGIGDNVNTYNGVAPKADLYAIKVFGSGSVGNAVVIKALEYAADPNGDFNLQDKLDVVNMSLGSSYGGPHQLYRKAIRNLTNSGTVVVASAGNSGHTSYITGAPGSVDESISVAASIDDMDHNIKTLATAFETPTKPDFKTVSLEGAFSKKLKDLGKITGELVYAGLADTDFTQDQKDEINGRVALIQRGNVSFIEKATRAHDAGAIGVVIFNNRPGAPIVMGGDGSVDLPAVMIDQEAGEFLKKEMEAGVVTTTLSADDFIFNFDLVDTLTSFSSRGPRLTDALLKPEISAPGYNIISAALGTGDKGTRMSGTSMSGPHIAGVMALIKQKSTEIEAALQRPLTNEEFKALLMNSAKRINRDKTTEYPVAQQGAGRVQVYESLATSTIATPSSFSLGQHYLINSMVMNKLVKVINLDADKDKTYQLKFDGHPAFSLLNSHAMTVSPLSEGTLSFDLEINPDKLTEYHNELDGFIQVVEVDGTEETIIGQIPALMIATKVAGVDLAHHSVTTTDVNVSFSNFGSSKGKALVFNLLGKDEAVRDIPHFTFEENKDCDLKSVGYRIKTDDEGKRTLEFGYELYDSRNSFQPCELLVLIDTDKDDVVDFELIGAQASNMGLPGSDFQSMLFDAKEMRKERRRYEQSHFSDSPFKQRRPNFQVALKGLSTMEAYQNSSIAVTRFDLKDLEIDESVESLNVKILIDRTSARGLQRDDYLAHHQFAWESIKLKSEDVLLSDANDFDLDFADSKAGTFKFGNSSRGNMVVYMPQNAPGERSKVIKLR